MMMTRYLLIKPTIKPLNDVRSCLSTSSPDNPSRDIVKSFIDENFGDEFSTLKEANLTDFNPNPTFLNSISDEHLKGFGSKVHSYWDQLARVQDLFRIMRWVCYIHATGQTQVCLSLAEDFQ